MSPSEQDIQYPYPSYLDSFIIEDCTKEFGREIIQLADSIEETRGILERNFKLGVIAVAADINLEYGKHPTAIFNSILRGIAREERSPAPKLLHWKGEEWRHWRRINLGLHGASLPEHHSEAELLWRLSSSKTQEMLLGRWGVAAAILKAKNRTESVSDHTA